VAVKLDSSGRLTAAGYLLSQEELVKGLEADTDFDYGAYRSYQVKVSRIEKLTGLSFGALVDADALERVEATTDVIDLETLDRIVW
jgi:endonuclease G